MSTAINRRTDADGRNDVIIPGWPYDRPEYTSLAAAVQGESSRWNIPGIAMAVLKDGEITTTSAGFANLFTSIAMRDDTLSQIGSISKVFTTTLVMQLVEEGLLDLDTPVITYIPDLPLADEEARSIITLRHLLSHTSGIEGDRFVDQGRGDDALARTIATFDTLRQWTAPGDLWSYCNTGFYLASRIVEVVTGQVFEDVIKERLFDPLGLETAFFHGDDAISYPHAVGHNLSDRNEGHTRTPAYHLGRFVNGTGGIICSTSDLLRFAQLHLGLGEIDGKRLISKKHATAMQTPVTEAGDFSRSYGLGWCIHDYPEFRTFSHGGATYGFKASLVAVPEHNFAMSILTNGSAGNRAMAELEDWALKHFLELVRPETPRVSLSAKKLAAVAGTYERHDAKLVVAVVDDRLDLTVSSFDEETGEEESSDSFPLIPASETRFVVPDGAARNSTVDFIPYTRNGEEHLLLRRGGRLAVRQDAAAGKETSGSSSKIAARAKKVKENQKDTPPKPRAKGKKKPKNA